MYLLGSSSMADSQLCNVEVAMDPCMHNARVPAIQPRNVALDSAGAPMTSLHYETSAHQVLLYEFPKTI